MDLILTFLEPPVVIYNKNPTSHGRSGYYVLQTDHLFFAYCDMELDCGGIKGSWMRVADRWTHKYTVQEDQQLAYFPTNSTWYDKVFGKAVGYQKGNMDGFTYICVCSWKS